MIKAARKVAILLGLCAIISSCDSDSTNIGSSLIQVENDIVIDKDFVLTGQTIDNERIQSRTTTQLLGAIEAKGYGTFRSDFVTQFMPVAQLDTNLRRSADIDSVKLVMLYRAGSFIGDSVVPMGLEVYPLTKQLPAPIFSDFDPADYYETTPIGRSIYGASNLEAPTDSIKKLGYGEIKTKLPVELGRQLFDLYKTDPSAYLSPSAFAPHFPGLYIRQTYGSGRVTRFDSTTIRFWYHRDDKTAEGNDTTYYYNKSFFIASPEVVINNNIDYTISPVLTSAVSAGETLIVAPAGLDVEVTFPLRDIIDRIRDKSGDLTVINDLTLNIPAQRVTNDYGIGMPQNLLLVLKNKRQQFFEKSEVSDGIKSFIGTYNEYNGRYDFTSMRNYLLDALNREDPITAEDYTFVLTPVNLETESTSGYSITSVVKSITPYVQQPVMTRLLLDKAEIILTFSNQNTKK